MASRSREPWMRSRVATGCRAAQLPTTSSWLPSGRSLLGQRPRDLQTAAGQCAQPRLVGQRVELAEGDPPQRRRLEVADSLRAFGCEHQIAHVVVEMWRFVGGLDPMDVEMDRRNDDAQAVDAGF